MMLDMTFSEGDRRGISPEQAALDSAVVRYRNAWEQDSLTPDGITDVWQAFWDERLAASGSGSVKIPQCDRDTEELAALRKEGRGVVLVPEVFVQEPGGIALLGKLFPQMGISPNFNGLYTNKLDTAGICVDVEMDGNAPHREQHGKVTGVTVKEATKSYTEERQPLSLALYIAASQLNKRVFGEYFDQNNTISIVDGTNLSWGDHDRDHSKRSLEARFEPTGRLIVKTISPFHDSGKPERRGYRTAGIK